MRAPHAALEYLAVSSEASVESQLISESTSLAHLHQHVRTTITKWVKGQTNERLAQRLSTQPANRVFQKQLLAQNESRRFQLPGSCVAALSRRRPVEISQGVAIFQVSLPFTESWGPCRTPLMTVRDTIGLGSTRNIISQEASPCSSHARALWFFATASLRETRADPAKC